MKDMTSPTTPWWNNERHADRRAALLARGRIKAAIRRWFEAEGFIEVDAGCLAVSPGNETHLQAFKTELMRPGGASRQMFLHTSPEFAAKKLIAAGETRLFTFAQVFRNNERGALHVPEFTMLEWYRAEPGADHYEAIKADCAKMIDIAAETTSNQEWHWNGRLLDTSTAPASVTVPELLADLFSIDLLKTITPQGTDRDSLAAEAWKVDIHSSDDETWDDIFSKLMVEAELRYGELPQLNTYDNKERALILDHYPAATSPLARPVPSDQRLAGRFEVFAAGIELANGFAENNDSTSVRAGLSAEMDEKLRIYSERYPLDEDFLEAVTHLPDGTAGCALGFDRLVMLATGAPNIDSVIWTPLSK